MCALGDSYIPAHSSSSFSNDNIKINSHWSHMQKCGHFLGGVANHYLPGSKWWILLNKVLNMGSHQPPPALAAGAMLSEYSPELLRFDPWQNPVSRQKHRQTTCTTTAGFSTLQCRAFFTCFLSHLHQFYIVYPSWVQQIHISKIVRRARTTVLNLPAANMEQVLLCNVIRPQLLLVKVALVVV